MERSMPSSLELVSAYPCTTFTHGTYSDEGTGGTIAGIGQFLKSMREDILVVLSDPEGSGLYNKVRPCQRREDTVVDSLLGKVWRLV